MKKLSLIIVISTICLFIFPSKIFADADIVINEFSHSEEWVEIYNTSDQMVNLGDYALIDVAGNTKSFVCNLNPHGFEVIQSSNNWLNTGGDVVKLTKQGTIVDCVSYGDGAEQVCEGKSAVDISPLGSTEFGARSVDGLGSWAKVITNTKNLPNDGSTKDVNAICVVPTPTPIPSPTVMSTPIKTPTPAPVPTPTKTLIPTPTKTPTPRPILTIKPTATPEVLGDSTQESNPVSDSELGETPSPEPTEKTKTGSKKSAVILGVVFVVLGVFAMGIAGYSAYAKSKSSDS
jgi:hypothetical protein